MKNSSTGACCVRLLKTLLGFYPVLLPVTIGCIVFNAVVGSLPSVFMQKVIALVEQSWQDGCNLVRRTEKGRLRRRGWGLRWEKAQKGGKGTNLRGFFED